MRYNIRINDVISEDSHVKAFATVTFADSFQVGHVAIIKRSGDDTLFVSMPSYRTNDVTEKGEPIFRDICNPITKEFYEELTTNILSAYTDKTGYGRQGLDVNTEQGKDLPFRVSVSAFEREGSSLRGFGKLYLEDNFVVSNVKLIQGDKGLFISMPDYRTDKIKDGKPVYRDICYPVTKEFREKLLNAFEKEYKATLSKSETKDKAKEEPVKTEKKARTSKTKEKEPTLEPALAR